MVTKELILSEMETLSKQDLDELYEIIRHFAQAKQHAGKTSLLARLRSIVIDAPEDFAADHDLYVVGEKSAQSDLG